MGRWGEGDGEMGRGRWGDGEREPASPFLALSVQLVPFRTKNLSALFTGLRHWRSAPIASREAPA